MAACIFCAIADRRQDADIVCEDDDVMAFHDIHPKYPVHVLIIPKRHVASVAGATAADDALLGKLLRVGAEIAKERGVAESGFRLLTNVGPDAGQAVDHIHLHLIGGEPLRPL